MDGPLFLSPMLKKSVTAVTYSGEYIFFLTFFFFSGGGRSHLPYIYGN
jgi:hypothetical protein